MCCFSVYVTGLLCLLTSLQVEMTLFQLAVSCNCHCAVGSWLGVWCGFGSGGGSRRRTRWT